MSPPSDSPSARARLPAAPLKPLRLHPVPARLPGTALRRGGFEPDGVASFLAGLAAQYEAGARVFPSPLATPRPAAARSSRPPS